MKRRRRIIIPISIAIAALLVFGITRTCVKHAWFCREGNAVDTFLVTNPFIDNFMREVDYTDVDDTTTLILGFPGGGPGEADIPPAVHLTWKKRGAIIVHVQECPRKDSTALWSWDYKVAKDSSYIDIINLVPGRDYAYYVLNTNGDTLAKGRFYAKGTMHHAFLRKGTRNMRDLGGWPTDDGRHVAFRKLYRGGRIVGEDGTSVYINAEGREDARALGIGAELDLRQEGSMPDHSPLGKGVTFCGPGFPLGGATMLGEYKENVAKSFHFIVRSLHEGRGVFFHCSAGRDRTGTLAVLLLGVLGVSEANIGKEYELTYFAPKGYSMYSKSPDQFYHTRKNGARKFCKFIWNKSPKAESFKQACEDYLISLGVSKREIEDFRNLVLE